RGLILIDTQAQQEDPSKTPGYKQMIDIWTAQGLPDAIADTIADIILGAGAPQAAAWKAKWRAWKPHNLLAAFQTLVSRDDISAQLADIRIPALVIHGDADIAITLDRAVDMQKRLAGSRLAGSRLDIIAGAGHASNLTHAASVNAAIERFLQTLQVDPNSNHPGDKS
ncbi:alpha/beta hydrolase, partial [Thiomonas sp.]